MGTVPVAPPRGSWGAPSRGPWSPPAGPPSAGPTRSINGTYVMKEKNSWAQFEVLARFLRNSSLVGRVKNMRHVIWQKSALVLNLKDRNASKEVWTARMPRFFKQKNTLMVWSWKKRSLLFCTFVLPIVERVGIIQPGCEKRLICGSALWVQNPGEALMTIFHPDCVRQWFGWVGEVARPVRSPFAAESSARNRTWTKWAGSSLQWLKRLLTAKELAGGPPIELLQNPPIELGGRWGSWGWGKKAAGRPAPPPLHEDWGALGQDRSRGGSATKPF